MITKKYLAFLGITLIGISISFSGFSDIDRKRPVSDKEESKKIAQVNNENNKKTIFVMDYDPIPFTRLIGMADLGVIGTVTDIGDSIFQFHVDEFLLHNHASRSINVTKYIPSVLFAPRSLPYSKEQRFALFLMKPEQDSADHPWNILGYTGEGEMPIDGEFIYFEGSNLEGLERKQYEVQGVSRNLQRFNLPDFKDAVQNYGECFSWELVEYIKNNKKRERWQPSKKCPDVTVKTYQAKSWIHEYLVQETIKKIPVHTNE